MDNRERDGTLRAKIGRLVASSRSRNPISSCWSPTAASSSAAVADISINGRKTRGVIVFNIAEGERVVSVERLTEDETEGE